MASFPLAILEVIDVYQQTNNWKDFINLIKDTKPSKTKLSIAILMSVMTTMASLLIPLFTKNVVDTFTMDSINATMISILLVVFIVQAISSGFSIYLLNYVGQEVVANLRTRLWEKFLLLPISFYDEYRIGELISQMTNDTAVVKGLITDHVTRFFTGIVSIIGSVIVLVILDWKMSAILFTGVPLSLVVLMVSGKHMNRISRGTQYEAAQFTAVLNKVLSEIRLVKASNAEEIELENGKKRINNLYRYGLKEGKVQALISPVMSSVLMLVLVIILGYGGMRVTSGALSAGDLVAFILYMFQIFTPLTSFTNFHNQVQKTKGATERIIATLNHYIDDYDSGHALHSLREPIKVENLSFAYKENVNVLSNLNFTANPGKITAIVGPSGGGKTTLFSLLERYYQPILGHIKLGDKNIKDFSLASWRGRIGYVPQESPIVAGTIRENITYGLQRKVSDDEIRQVSEMAYAHQFINELSLGYDTEVGERGIRLSGGQRQRIGIARALLRDPDILMLDEATSSLDSISEIYVQKAIENLMRGRTTFIIAHRLSTVADADQILFLEKGKITGKGTHHELVDNHEMYQNFAYQQLQTNQEVVN